MRYTKRLLFIVLLMMTLFLSFFSFSLEILFRDEPIPLGLTENAIVGISSTMASPKAEDQEKMNSALRDWIASEPKGTVFFLSSRGIMYAYTNGQGADASPLGLISRLREEDKGVLKYESEPASEVLESTLCYLEGEQYKVVGTFDDSSPLRRYETEPDYILSLAELYQPEGTFYSEGLPKRDEEVLKDLMTKSSFDFNWQSISDYMYSDTFQRKEFTTLFPAASIALFSFASLLYIVFDQLKPYLVIHFRLGANRRTFCRYLVAELGPVTFVSWGIAGGVSLLSSWIFLEQISWRSLGYGSLAALSLFIIVFFLIYLVVGFRASKGVLREL